MLDLLTDPIVALIASHLGVPAATVAALVTTPAKGVAGDVAIPCFQLAKARGVAPALLATELSGLLAGSSVAAVAAGPFLNLTFPPPGVAAALLPPLSADPLLALRATGGAGKTVCIDFSSPNIAKHLAFHHIRSTMIGNALARLYAALGYRVVRINFLGDWGTSFGKLIAGWKHDRLTIADLEHAVDQVSFLHELYVRISNAAKAEPAIEDEARQWSKRLEDGDPEARELWQLFKDVSLAEFKRVYALLGVDFDSWKGESHYEGKMGAVLDELEAKSLTRVDPGALVGDLTTLGFKKPALLKRADGGTLYATRDLAACDDRWSEYRFDRSLYVVDLGQALHFKEWFAIARLLGRTYADRLRHVGFGIVLMWNDDAGDGQPAGWARVATRKGKVMLLREVLEEAVERARAVIIEKNPEIIGAERERIAHAVGIGAVVFNDLKSGRNNDVKFRFDEALRFDGETGPYLQFAHARLCSIERKFHEAHPHTHLTDPALLAREDEKQVLLAIARLRAALERAVESDEPSVMAGALLALAGQVASWLTAGNHEAAARVLCPDQALATARLALVRAARACLGEGLRLIGLQAPERM
jgi:arginyl-tRNA synthetase